MMHEGRIAVVTGAGRRIGAAAVGAAADVSDPAGWGATAAESPDTVDNAGPWQGQAIQRFGKPADVVGPALVRTSDDAADMT
jgi:NAD(P)-dependent dehydrogenase (short-subunit alcohol dehydrogenase family)